MSVEGCFTDFHIDFGGTSVWYHILRGGKVSHVFKVQHDGDYGEAVIMVEYCIIPTILVIFNCM